MIDFKQDIADILSEAEIGFTREELLQFLEVPADPKMGDYALPCFRLAKVLRKAPPLIAADIAEKVAGNDFFEKVEAVNGFEPPYILDYYHKPVATE